MCVWVSGHFTMKSTLLENKVTEGEAGGVSGGGAEVGHNKTYTKTRQGIREVAS